MDDILGPLIVIGMLFIGLPWVVFHYISRWKLSGRGAVEDERLLDELHDIARRLEGRVTTIERIIESDRAIAAATRPPLSGNSERN